MENKIIDILELIKKQTGLELKLCDYFTGMHTYKGNNYFNIITKKRISESSEYILLERFANKFNKITIEPNGLKRIAIIIRSNNL